MEKIKKIVSHGSRKSDDTPNKGGPASPTTSNQLSSTGSADYHPIYDQFTSQDPTATSPREPTKTTDHPPRTPTTADLSQNPPDSAKGFAPSPTQAEYTQSSASSSLRPDTLSSRTGLADDMSTASIKSGVLGFPPGGHRHAAFRYSSIEHGLDTTQPQGTSLIPGPSSEEQQSSSPLAGDAALGAGASEAPRHELHRSYDHDNLRATQESNSMTTGSAAQESLGHGVAQTSREEPEPLEQSFNKSSVTKNSDRSFPLSGGVVPANTSAISNNQSHGVPTKERELDTRDRDAGTTDGDSREALAGAAAAASGVVIASTISQSDREPPKSTQEVLSEPSEPSRGTEGYNGAALGGTTAVGIASSTVPQSEPEPTREQPGKEPILPNQEASGGLFASELHDTDTANRRDPHFHIPGEFPETPMETPLNHSQGRTRYLSETSYQPQPRSTDTSTTVNTQPQSGEQHHYGRDAAVATTAGAVGLGAYEASKHHERETPAASPEPIENYSNPYTSQKLDPRLGGISSTFEEQRFDPQAPTEPSPQSSNRTTIAGGAGLTPQLESTQPTSQAEEEPQKEHNYGRDAAVAGAGAATVGGLVYANQHSSEKLEEPELQKSSAESASPDLVSHTPEPHVVNDVDSGVETSPNNQKTYEKDQYYLGGAGTAEYGAHETATYYDEHRSTQPSASMNDQRYDPTAPGAHAPLQTSQIHSHEHDLDRAEEPQKEHHYGRDAAIVGGLGAVGAGTYAATRDHDSTGQPQSYSGNEEPGAHKRYDSVQSPNQQRQAEDVNQHQGRNMAAVGTAAGVAGAGAGYAYSQRDAEKERIAQQKEMEAQHKAQQKDFEAKQKQQQKDFEHQQKELKKQQAKDQKHHNKFVAAEDKAYQKELEKEQSKQQQEAEKAEEKEEKKHHGLLGFLHRDKKDKDRSSPEESPRHSKEYIAGPAAGATTTAAAYEAHDKRKKLHKDPPKGHPARKALERGSPDATSGQYEHTGMDSPTRRSNGSPSGYSSLRSSNHGSSPINDQQPYAAESNAGLPMNTERYGDVPGVENHASRNTHTAY